MVSRRRMMEWTLAGAAYASLGGCCQGIAGGLDGSTGAAAAGIKPPTKPNVLFIPIDDLRPQLGCYGHKQMHTPRIDALAAEGLLLERAYCQQALCAPSRASLLTGCRPDTTGVTELQQLLAQRMPGALTLPRHFKDNGYRSISLGKVYHHYQKDDPDGWSEAPWQPEGEFLDLNYRDPESLAIIRKLEEAGGGREKDFGARQELQDTARGRGRRDANSRKDRPPPDENMGNSKRPWGPAYEIGDVEDNEYPDGMIADRAIEELRQMGDSPFFLAVGFHKPHLPFNAPRRYWDLYDRDKVDLADNPFAPKDCPPDALHNWDGLRRYYGIPKTGPVDEATARALIHGYYACASYVDTQIGRVLDALDEVGLRDNTVVVLWGDHGWQLGEHGLWCKHSNFETSVHSPLAMRVPWLRSGIRSAALCEFVDVYPTLCELCGLSLPSHLEGTSFVPLFDDPDRSWKSGAFSQYPRGREVVGHSVRTDRYRYTRWVNTSGSVTGTELYDHEVDPGENVNVAADAAHAAVAREMAGVLDAGWRSALPA